MDRTKADEIIATMRKRAEDAEEQYRQCHKGDREYPDELLHIKNARWNAFSGAVAFYQAMCEHEQSTRTLRHEEAAS